MLYRPYSHMAIVSHCITIMVLLLILSAPSMAGQRQKLIITHDANYEPLVYKDEQGLPQGYLIDFWKHFGEANNIDISFKLGSWEESMDWVRNGQADVHAGLFFTMERATFLDFGEPITGLSAAIYITKGLTWNDFLSRPIGVVKGGYAEFFMQTVWSSRQVKSFPQARDMIQAAVAGKIKAFIADQPIAVFYLREFKGQDLLLKYEETYSSQLRVATAKGRNDLNALLHQGWARMDVKKLNYIRGKWFLDVGHDNKWILTGVLVTALIIFIGLLFRILGQKYPPLQE
ncbi:transporter substrate-binding domain-containing protein [uncultured Pseudodesulfovibrio sp.]|uniref:transporter substrate-binding domain-containing protein n=1 Tax=uncultured Pseudodesulfovibrio sp. TaxID=2035858 RepID=UPI0029C8E7C6|nr:transporter substrate-binding domain-containing protein [uncultured Pseudodesulfovibrio sp.]